MEIFMVAIPAVAILFFIGFEIPAAWRRQFVKLPIFITTTIFALIIGHVGRGVFGPIAAFVGEIGLFIGLLTIRKGTKWGEERERRTQCSKSGISVSERALKASSQGTKTK